MFETDEISSTMLSTASDPAAALVTIQPTNTCRPNLLWWITLQQPRSSILKPSSLNFSSVSNIVVFEWAEKCGVPLQGSIKSAQYPSSFKRPHISLQLITVCSVSFSLSASTSSDHVLMSCSVIMDMVMIEWGRCGPPGPSFPRMEEQERHQAVLDWQTRPHL